jgi:hypothetical protein
MNAFFLKLVYLPLTLIAATLLVFSYPTPNESIQTRLRRMKLVIGGWKERIL